MARDLLAPDVEMVVLLVVVVVKLLLVVEVATGGEICTMMTLKKSLRKIIMSHIGMVDFIVQKIMVMDDVRRRGLVN